MARVDTVAPLLVVRDLSKTYIQRSAQGRDRRPPYGGGAPYNRRHGSVVREFLKSWTHREPRGVAAVSGVGLELWKGSTLAIVGGSGAGKSTLARCMAGLERPSSGEIWFGGRRIEKGERMIQLIFQDPGASLNPRFSIARALEEPLAIHHAKWTDSDIVQRIEQVGLSGGLLSRRTGELSGGQKARLALARALAAFGDHEQAGILILDESLSSLDLSVQAQIINLLVDLQERHGLTYVLIAHDLSLAGHLADEVVVMLEGRIVERGAPQAVFGAPEHPYTKCLVSAVLAPAGGADPNA